MSGFQTSSRFGDTRARAVFDELHYQVLRAGEVMAGLAGRVCLDEDRRLRLVRTCVTVAVAVLAIMLSAVFVRGGLAEESRSADTGIRGTAGGDTLLGTDGGEKMSSRDGPDVVLARGGDDTVSGGTGNDMLDGGPGNDVLHAGPGSDVLVGGSGNDVLHASDLDANVDRLVCGAGDDVAHVVSVNGKLQDRTVECERIVVTHVRVKRAKH